MRKLHSETIDRLKQKYPDINFLIREDEYTFEILHDNKNLTYNDEFLDNIFDICEPILSEDQLWNLTILYDVLDEMKNPTILTNADRIRQMSDEELAEWIDKQNNQDREDWESLGYYPLYRLWNTSLSRRLW